jgi:threonine/homoserine/homoserine lactone efflux protein
MPDLATLAVFALAAGVLVVIPGPNHIYIVTRGVAGGRRAGLASAFGVETGTLVHVAAAAVGLSALIASSAVAFTVVKYLGAAYLVYLGVRALLSDKPLQFDDLAPRERLRSVYLDGLVVNVLNPKVALFFLAFLPQFIDPDRGSTAGQIVVLGLLLALLGLASDIVYAVGAGALGGWLRRRPRFLRRQRYVTGSIYIALGAAAAVSGETRR